MQKRHILICLCVIIVFFFLNGCKKNTYLDNNKLGSFTKDTLVIGIVSVVSHQSLDLARFGFIQRLDQFSIENGKTIYYEYQSANLSKDKEVSIISSYIGKHVDLILTIGTSPTTTAQNLTQNIPIVFAAVTNPEGDKIVNSIESPGANVTGASDLYPVKEQLKLIKEFFPKTIKVGFIYNNGETNSSYIVELAGRYSNELGISIVHATAEKTVDISVAVSAIINKIDVLVMPTDNTAAAAVLVIGNICLENHIPFFSTELESVQKGLSIASTYTNYNQVGYESGIIAQRIFNGESPGQIPVRFLDNYDLVINKKLLKMYGVKLSKERIETSILID